MTKIEWDGIPERYWPDTEKPWRVTWGIGQFEDFATEEEAQRFYARQESRGTELLSEPFNAVEA